MLRKILLFVGVVVGAFMSVTPVDASIVTIEKTGEVTVNVLSAESENSEEEGGEIKVTDSSVEIGEADMPISLSKKDGKYFLSIASKDGEKSFDVTGSQDRILEIEERPSVKKIGISILNNQFVIEQRGIKAVTSYQINVEPKMSKITILTPTGYKFLSVLPSDAMNILLRSNTISSSGNNASVEILEDGKGNLYYGISGTKKVGIKDMYMFDAPVSAKISAVNGEVMEIDEPIWLKILNLFTVQT